MASGRRQNQTLFPQMSGKGPFTVEASGYEAIKGETIPRRHPDSKDQLATTPSDDIQTIFDIVKRGSERFGNAKALGTRKVLKTHVESKMVKKVVEGRTEEVEKKWTYFELSGYTYLSFAEYEQQILQLGAGLRKLGLQKDDRLHMFGATSANWLAMTHGATSQSMPIVTAYDTLGEEGLRHSLVQAEASAIFCDSHLLPTLLKPLESATGLKHIVYNIDAEVKHEHIDQLKSKFEYLTILSFDELRKLGEANMVPPTPPSKDDLCCIMYTSGSTGPPKGAPLKHKAVIASIAGVTAIVGQYIGPGDGLLTYLPQAHILEYVFENSCLYWGGTMGYGSPKTLSDASVRNCKGDVREFKPTILVGVPAVWESIRKGILVKVEAGGVITKNLFWGAMAAKSFLLAHGLPGAGLLDAIVFNKVKDATGGRLKLCMSGGGPVSKDTQHFVSMAIAPMISGYGLTETTAMGVLQDPLHWSINSLGDIPSSVEVKLVDYADAGYFAHNKPPQGEIWIRGDSVIESYYKNEDETKEAITEDGWFKTGDIGEWDHNGQLRLIDRKKNLVKTANGEYIALEKLESIYRTVPAVGNICVYAASDKPKPIAIIMPVEPALKAFAEKHGIQGHGIEDLSHNDKLNRLLLKELQTTGRNGGLTGIQLIDGLVIAGEEWTPANGLLTAAQKIQRKPILTKYQKQVNKAYGDA